MNKNKIRKLKGIYFIIIVIFIFILISLSKDVFVKKNVYENNTIPSIDLALAEKSEANRIASVAFSEKKAGVKSSSEHDKAMQTLGTQKINIEKVVVREPKVKDISGLVKIFNKGRNENVWCDINHATSDYSLKQEFDDIVAAYGQDNVILLVSEYENKPVGFVLGIIQGDVIWGKAFMFDTDIDQDDWIPVARKQMDTILDIASERGIDKTKVLINKEVWMHDFLMHFYSCDQKSDSELNCRISGYRKLAENPNHFKRKISYTPGKNNIVSTTSAPQPSKTIREKQTHNIVKQDQYSNHYKLPDGSIMAEIYSTPINYFDDGWKEITDDAPFLEKKDGKIKSRFLGVEFSENSFFEYKTNTTLFRQINISMGYADSNQNTIFAPENVKTLSSNKNVALPNIFKDVDLVYQTGADRIKEAYIFNKLPEVNSPDLENGSIIITSSIEVVGARIESTNWGFFIKDKNGMSITFADPFIIDQEGRRLNLRYELKKLNETNYLVVTKIPYAWMESDDKAYPLVLDPSLSVESSDDLVLIYSGVKEPFFFKFNISSIPFGSNVTSAKLYLTDFWSGLEHLNKVYYARRFNDQTWNEASPNATFANHSNMGGMIDIYNMTLSHNHTISPYWVFNITNATNGLIEDVNMNNTYFSAEVSLNINLYNYTEFQAGPYCVDCAAITIQDDGKSAFGLYMSEANTTERPFINVAYIPPYLILNSGNYKYVKEINTSERVSEIGQYGNTSILTGVNSSLGNYSALLVMNLVQHINVTNITMNISRNLAKSFFHNSSTITGLVNISLLIPRITGSNQIYICPGATSLDAVNQSCTNKITISNGSSSNGMSVTTTTYDGEDYYLVSNITSTGGGEANIPVMNTSRILPTPTATDSQNLIGYCNATDADNDSLFYYQKWYKNDVLFYQGISFKNGSISAGYYHTCGVRSNDSLVFCWGDNTYGQLGNGSVGGNQSSPVQINDTSAYISVSAGRYHSCGIRKNDSMALCWGSNTYGEMGRSTPASTSGNPLEVNTSNSFSKIDIGYDHSCGIRTNDSTIMCWGRNNVGQIGNGSTSTSNSINPKSIADTTPYMDISSGEKYSCGIRANDSIVICWGYNLQGQLGNGTSGGQTGVPNQINDSSAYISVSAGGTQTCAIRANDSRVLCWGSNSYGQLGVGFEGGGTIANPSLTVDVNPYIIVSSEYRSVCGITADANIYCWGNNLYGQLGNGSLGGNQSTPTAINSSNKYVNIYSSNYYVCAVRAVDGIVVCWGINNYGQLSNGLFGGNQSNPIPITDTSSYAGRYNQSTEMNVSFAIHNTYTSLGENWTLSCQAYDTYNKSTWQNSTSTQISNSTGVTISSRISPTPTAFSYQNLSGYCNATYINNDSLIYQYLWYKNSVPFDQGFVFKNASLSVGGLTSCAIRANDSTILCWGYNLNGELGRGVVGGYYTNIVQINSSDKFKMVSVGGGFTCAIRKNDSKVLCWGANELGQLGTGTNGTANPNPALINDTSAYSYISSGQTSTCGIRANDSKVLCWGSNAYGKIGAGTANMYEANPLLLNSTVGYLKISVGYDEACGIRLNDSKILCWGSNALGQLAVIETGDRSSPTLIKDNSSFIDVVSEGETQCGIRANDSKVLCWGYNYYGQMANGSWGGVATSQQLINDSSTYISINPGSSHVCGLLSNYSIKCWGSADNGRLGNGLTSGNITTPSIVANSNKFVSLSIYGHSCALNTQGQILCWGWNLFGGLGNGNTSDMAYPTLINDSAYYLGRYNSSVEGQTSQILSYALKKSDNWTLSCNALNTTDSSDSTNSTTTTLTSPLASIFLVSPSSNINATQNRFFNVTLNVTCTSGNCGNINVTLDPTVSWWNISWPYRLPFTVNISTGTTPQNYQTKIILNSSNVGANWNWTDECINSSWSRARIINASHQSELSFWIESCSNTSNNMTIWVKVDQNITTTPSTLFYIYYGNALAGPKTNGTATFDFFDDFSQDLSKWTRHITSGVYPKIDNQTLVSGGGSTGGAPYGHTVLGSNATYANFTDGIIEGKIYLNTSAIAEVGFRGSYGANTGYKSRMDARTGEGLSHQFPPYSGWALVGGGCSLSGTGITAGSWLDFSVTVSGTSFTIATNGQTKTCSDGSYSGPGEISLQNHYGTASIYDDVRVRKYVSSEPSSSIGSEQYYVNSKGIISTTTDSTPFWTNASSNPTTVNLNEGESTLLTFWVNATGDINSTWDFFAFSNLTSDMSASNTTTHFNITIISLQSSCTYSGSGSWTISGADNCVISTNYNLGGNQLILTGPGNVTFTANVTNWSIRRFEQGIISKKLS